MELSRLIQHPEEMNRETLYDLRALLALYPYYQTARLLMLQNLYLLHDTSFDEELRRAAIYISDRRKIFQMVEAAHYQLKSAESSKASQGAALSAPSATGKAAKGDRTSDLIDHFLGSIPMDAQDTDGEKKEKRKPTPADASVDYVAYLMETEPAEKPEEPSRTISLIDDFMEDGGFKLSKIKSDEEYKPEYTPQLAQEDDNKGDGTPKAADEETENSGVFTETLARIYIKQGKYERAHKIIERLHKQHPDKSAYYKDQLRFLEKLILNAQGAKKKKN